MVKYGVLVISHGSRSESWVRLVEETVYSVRLPEGVPIFSSYLELVEGRLIQDGITFLESLGVTDLIVIPMFVSSGSTHVADIRSALGVKSMPELSFSHGLKPFSVRARVHITAPIDDDPIIAGMVYQKIASLSVDPSREIVLLVGHGSMEKGFHLLWRRGMERLAARIKTIGGFAEADAAMLLPNQIPHKMKWWQKQKPGHTILASPLFLSEGYFTKQVIPERLKGFDCRYSGQALLPHPDMARWIERQIAPFWE